MIKINLNDDHKFYIIMALICLGTVSGGATALWYIAIWTWDMEINEYQKPIDCNLINSDPDNYFPRKHTLVEKHTACESYNKHDRFTYIDELQKNKNQLPTVIIPFTACLFVFLMICTFTSVFANNNPEVILDQDKPKIAPCRDIFDEYGRIVNTKCNKMDKI